MNILFSFFVATIFSVSLQAHDEEIPKFNFAYKDSSGLTWSKTLPRKYSNGCADQNGYYDPNRCFKELAPDGTFQVKLGYSKAADTCRKIGARLPTVSEYRDLIKDFDHTVKHGEPVLSDKGLGEMEAQFGDDTRKARYFWSSTIDPWDTYAGSAYAFYVRAIDQYGIRRESTQRVRCVRGDKR